MTKIIFIEADGKEKEIEAQNGLSILEVAHKNGISLEGACEGSLACSTCHIILEKKIFDKLPEPSEEEEDMLDLALELTDTSRLSCQISYQKELNGCRIRLPKETSNYY